MSSTLVTTKEELTYMKQVAETAQNELEQLFAKQAAQTLEIEEMADKIKVSKVRTQIKGNCCCMGIQSCQILKRKSIFPMQSFSKVADG